MQQEKSRARLSTPDRPVRYSVFVIFRAIPSNRLIRIASSAPSNVVSAMGYALALWRSVESRRVPAGRTTRLPLSARLKVAARSMTIDEKGDSIIAGPTRPIVIGEALKSQHRYFDPPIVWEIARGAASRSARYRSRVILSSVWPPAAQRTATRQAITSTGECGSEKAKMFSWVAMEILLELRRRHRARASAPGRSRKSISHTW